MDLQQIKQRFGIIGNSQGVNRAISIAKEVAPTDLSVLITGESGVGKEVFPQIIHNYSSRKHQNYIAVNCGAIPEGTIDSELFGHEKGAFTGATSDRKGYFESANNGTIFLDEIGELPLSTQVRLLRVLESGEFIKVGSSKIIKTDVRVVAATNVKLMDAIENSKFREDLFYRLNTVPVVIPPLRHRKEDINLLFRKFANDFAEKYRMPSIKLDNEAKDILINYNWPGNIRQLKNITEQISIIEPTRLITGQLIKNYLPIYKSSKLPALYKKPEDDSTFNSEREILYKVLFDMKRDMTDLKKLVMTLMQKKTVSEQTISENEHLINKVYSLEDNDITLAHVDYMGNKEESSDIKHTNIQDTEEVVDESLSIEDKEYELITKALEKHKGRNKDAAIELGISERTLYRKKIKFNIK